MGADGMAARQPRYRAILAELRDRIARGAYPVGGTLPSEAELCAEFASSRFTVREALRRLQAEGLVSRQQGAGSRVLATSTAAFVQSYGSLADLLQLARETDFRKLSLRPARPDETLAPRIGAAPGETWTLLRGLRTDAPDGPPVSLIESWIPPRHQPLARTLAEGRPPFYRQIEDATGERVTEVTQETQALTSPGRIARPLGLAPDSPTLLILRKYQAGDKTLIASLNWHPGGQTFIHRTTLKLREE